MENRQLTTRYKKKLFSLVLGGLLLLSWATTPYGLQLKDNNKLHDNKKNRMVSSRSRLQVTEDEANSESSEDSGSIFDGQDVKFEEPDNTQQPTTAESPRKVVEDDSSDLDDRYAHMLEMEGSLSGDDIVTTTVDTGDGEEKPEEKPEESQPELKEVKEEQPKKTSFAKSDNGHNNYHLVAFDSSVKHDVYPSPETDSMISYGVAFVASMLAFMYIIKMLINYCKTTSYFHIRQFKMKAVYAILRDLAVMVFVLAIILCMHFHSYLDFFKTDLENLLYGVYIFLIVWIISSIVLLYSSYSKLDAYYDYESISKDMSSLERLKRIYEELYTDRQRIPSLITEQLHFQLMRQSFINPIELPILTESFLRRDFNFTTYLGYCITDFLSEIIGFISIRVYFLIFILLAIYKCINFINIEEGSAIIYPIPLVCLIILFLVKWHLLSIHKYLVAEVGAPEDINFQVDIDIRDPFDHYGNLQVPPYLQAGSRARHIDDSDLHDDTESEEESEESQAFIGKSTRRPPPDRGPSDKLNDSVAMEDSVFQREKAKEKQYKGIFKCRKRCCGFTNSRQERLFWFGKIGVYLQKWLIQGCYITLVLWLSAITAGDGFSKFYVFDERTYNIALMCGTIFIALFTMMFYFPTVVFVFVQDTSIQMMKRRDYIEIVIKEQKHQKALRSMRMYQVFKLIRREVIEHINEDNQDKPLADINMKVINENFDLVEDPYEPNRIDVEGLRHFCLLSGINLKKLESYVLLKKAQSDGETVTYDMLVRAINHTSNDVRVDPYDLIVRILVYIVEDGSDKLSIEKLQEFFDHYEGYFEEKDVEEFMDEILSLQRDGGYVDIQEIASLIRDDIECFPR